MHYNKKNLAKRVLTMMLTGSLLLGFAGCGNEQNSNNTPTNSAAPNTGTNTPAATNINFGLPENVQDGTIIQAWCWDFATIEENLADIAAAGFTGIQTSPINACIDPGGMALCTNGADKGMWYYHYQPLDWTIGNYQFGTRDEFAQMCAKAEEYGLKIIVDVVPNHTGRKESVAEGLANSVGGIDNLYHPNGFTNITKWSDRLQGTSYAMGGLADVDTENPGFQDYFIKFLNDCIECGADGFRFDTAKHIALPDDPIAVEGEENNFWPRATSKDEITNRDKVFMYGEILQGDNERMADYMKYLDGATASNYGNVIRGTANNKNLLANRFLNFNAPNVEPSQLVSWVESHDNYINDGTYKILDNDEVAFGWAALVSLGKTTPLFYSRPVGATKETWYGTINVIGVKGDDNYKNPIVVAANRFRNAMVGEEVEVTNIDTDNKVAMIARGSKGIVILNGTTESYSVSTAVKLADGTYTDRTGINGDFTVSGGTLTGTIAAGSVVVLYNEGYIELPQLASASIDLPDQFLYGDDAAVTLHCENAETAQYSITYPDAEGKYAIKDSEKITYKDGTSITPAANLKNGEGLILKLYATNKEGITSTKVYRLYKKDSIKKGDTITFIASKNWSTPVYAYLFYFNENGTLCEITDWPGAEMTNVEGLTYTYTFTEEIKTANVIFTDGTNKSPNSDDGKEVEAGKTY